MISEMLKVRDGRIRRILARSSILVAISKISARMKMQSDTRNASEDFGLFF